MYSRFVCTALALLVALPAGAGVFCSEPGSAIPNDQSQAARWTLTGSDAVRHDEGAGGRWCQTVPNEAEPVGGEFQVNTYTSNYQRDPAVAVVPSGDFVVVWQSLGSEGTDSSGASIQGQRYAPDGSALGGQFQVNSYTSNYQREPAVAVDSAGNFVVVWSSAGSGGTDSSAYSVQGQRFASDGSVLGGQFQVNTHTSSYQSLPAVAVDSAGDFVVVWDSVGSGGPDTTGTSIQGQRYASDGSVLGGEFQVNTYFTSLQRYPAVAVGSAGDFLVVWGSDGSSGADSSELSVQGQRYASDGSVLGDEFQINTYTTSFQSNPVVALDFAGNFVVVWDSDGSGDTDSDFRSIQVQRYASDGTVLGGQFQVNTYTPGTQKFPALAVDSAGDFMVSWQSDGSGGTDASSYSVQGQRYASGGTVLGGEFQINTYSTGSQIDPAVAGRSGSDFVVVWESYGSGGSDSSSDSIQGQRYWEPPFFADGFESGDTTAW